MSCHWHTYITPKAHTYTTPKANIAHGHHPQPGITHHINTTSLSYRYHTTHHTDINDYHTNAISTTLYLYDITYQTDNHVKSYPDITQNKACIQQYPHRSPTCIISATTTISSRSKVDAVHLTSICTSPAISNQFRYHPWYHLSCYNITAIPRYHPKQDRNIALSRASSPRRLPSHPGRR